MHVADLDGDGRDDLLLAGTDRFGVVLTDRKGQRLKPLASYESNRTEARLADLAAGDLNADGQPDIVLTDIGRALRRDRHLLRPVRPEPALAFRVFERKSFRDVNDPVEPRDLAIGDVDGDHRDDLVLIVHDRVLVYRQDPGRRRRQGEVTANEEIAMATVTMPRKPEDVVETTALRLLTTGEYDEMLRVGILREGEPVKLLGGLIRKKMGKNPDHMLVTTLVLRALQRVLPPGWDVVQ